jgi:orotate phosphoribosyltransferase
MTSRPDPLTPEEVRAQFESAGAILSGHFQLTSGRHSDTYVQCARVLEDTVLTTRLAGELAAGFDQERIDLVAAPAVGGIVIGFAVAQALGTPLVFSEREDGRMTFRRGFTVPEGDRVLVVEDVVTTGGSVAEVVDLVRASGAEVAGVAALIDRGGEKAFDAPYHPLLALHVDSWEPSDCALCAARKPLTSPGSRRLSG